VDHVIPRNLDDIYGPGAENADDGIDDELNFRELREANVERCEEVFHMVDDWSPCDWATAMAGECGEACNEVKKLRRLDGADALIDTPEKRQQLRINIGKELADLIIYADLLAARLGIDLSEAIRAKFNEVSEKRNSAIRL
jgi:NTP pyrophosphatase (non-canonical NTP hydrolase)